MEMSQQVERLFARRRFGIKPGLESERELLEVLGNPERSFAAVHVAGTNGKGSVSAILASVLTAAGFRTGLFTSPHLVRLNERFRVNRDMVDDAMLTRLMGRVEQAAEAIEAGSETQVTFFECCTAMAFEHFKANKVQLAVLETGMGGRLDATSVVTPAVSVITRIAMDHTAYLGDDLVTIAREKGGIIKPDRPVVIGAMPPEARDVLVQLAREHKAPLRDAADSVSIDLLKADLDGQCVKIETSQRSFPPVTVPLLGEYQLENLALAVATCEVLRDEVQLPLTDEALVEGVTTTHWEGRLQVLQQDPPVLVDGAHNPDAAHALARSLKRLVKGRPVALVLGMCADKHIRGTLQELAALKAHVWTVPLANERGLPAGDLQQLATSVGMDAIATDDLQTALAQASDWAGERDGAVCVAGSLFLAGELLQLWKAGNR